MFRSPNFNEVLANKAELINWRKVVGNEASLDDVHEDEEEIETEENQIADRIEPVAGPWATVARGLM